MGSWMRVLLMLTSLCMIGCRGGVSRPKTIPMTGVVTVKGKPLANGTVTFHPKSGRPATGQTDEEGKFTLMTFFTGDGAIPGEYVVTVAPPPWEPPANNPYAIPDQKYLKSKFNPIYTSQSQTPLKAVISADGPREIAFDLD